MRLHLDIQPQADRDLAEIAEYIATDNIDAAIRFLHGARRSMEFLTQTPGAGPEYVLPNSRLAGLRKWSLDGYRDYLIFYQVRGDAVAILRVIHGARDIPTVLEDESGERREP